MWKLTIEDDEGKQTQLPLAHEEYGIGRAETNAIRLTDRNVSRNHAQLKKNGQGWFLKDLQSYNGTYVNGVRVVGEQPIKGGDIVQLGDYRLELADEATAQPAAPAAAGAGAIPPVHQRPNRLVVVVGPSPGTEYPLDKEYFTMGRSEEATISVNHSSVSRLHAELFALGNGRFEIVDKGSANGIRINGVELKRGILEAGDALELGDVRLRFVGAGKIFRANVGQPLPGGFDAVSPGAAGRASAGFGKLIGLGAGVGVVAIVLLVLLLRTPTGGADTPPVHNVTLQGAEAKPLLEAKELVEKKDFAGAHKKLQEIPENSPAREQEAFKDIENAWTKWMFGRVDQSTDNAEKKKLLKEIAGTDTVDAQERKRAADKIREIEASEPPPPPPPPVHVGGPVGGPNPGGGGDVAPAPTPSSKTVPNLPSQGPPDEAAIRRSLENKVWSGRGSLEDIRMLKAICSHQGDRACRDRAAAMLKKKQEGG